MTDQARDNDGKFIPMKRKDKARAVAGRLFGDDQPDDAKTDEEFSDELRESARRGPRRPRT